MGSKMIRQVSIIIAQGFLCIIYCIIFAPRNSIALVQLKYIPNHCEHASFTLLYTHEWEKYIRKSHVSLRKNNYNALLSSNQQMINSLNCQMIPCSLRILRPQKPGLRSRWWRSVWSRSQSLCWWCPGTGWWNACLVNARNPCSCGQCRKAWRWPLR